MEEFKDMENDAFDAPNTPNAPNATATTREHKYKTASQNRQIMRQLKEE